MKPTSTMTVTELVDEIQALRLLGLNRTRQQIDRLCDLVGELRLRQRGRK